MEINSINLSIGVPFVDNKFSRETLENNIALKEMKKQEEF